LGEYNHWSGTDEPGHAERREMPITAVSGEDEFLRSEEVGKALESAGGAEVIRIDGDAEPVELSGVLDELRMRSLFTARKAVVIEGAKFLAQNAKQLADYILKESPALQDVVLVISAERVPAVVAKAAAKAGELREVRRMFATDYLTGQPSAGSPFGRWIAARARAMGMKLDAEAVVRAIEASGENTRAAAGLLDALALTGKGVKTAGDVEALSGSAGAAVPYRLEDAVLDADVAAALSLVDSAYRNGIQTFERHTQSEGTITAMLLRVLVQCTVNLVKLNEDASEEAAKAMRLHKARRGRYMAALKRLRGMLHELLDDAFRAEFAFKAGVMGGREMIEWLAARLCGIRGRSPESFGEALARR